MKILILLAVSILAAYMTAAALPHHPFLAACFAVIGVALFEGGWYMHWRGRRVRASVRAK